MNQKKEIVESLVKGVSKLCDVRGIRVLKGTGVFETAKKIRIKETGETVEGDAIIIATGSIPATLPIARSEDEGVLDSDRALSLRKIPASIIVIGGGYIGLEFAQIFRSLGSDVIVLEMLNQVLPSEDIDIARGLEGALQQEGIKILTGVSVKAISDKEGRKLVRYSIQNKESSLEAACILVAVGRQPNTEGLELQKVGIRAEKGRILVNPKMETSVSGVYAIGDATGGLMLAHVATAEGCMAANNILGNSKIMDYAVVPRCIHTYPEAASVGFTEAEAKSVYGEVYTGVFPLEGSGKARISGGVGFAKVICEKRYKKIVGVHLIGPHVTDLIGEAAVGMNLELTSEELAYTIHPHPTLSEMLAEAAMAIEGYKIHSA